MCEVIYHCAASLDGFIADDDGGVGWLDRVEAEGEDYGLGAFWNEVDALVMGRATYDFAMSSGSWPYEDKPTVVLTHRPQAEASRKGLEAVRFLEASPQEVVDTLRAGGARKIWLLGGGAVARDFANAGLLTGVSVSVIPVMLGSGAPLVAAGLPVDLELQSTRPFPSGLVQLEYSVRRG